MSKFGDRIFHLATLVKKSELFMAEFQSRNHNTLYLARVLGHVDRPPVFRGALKVAPGRLADVQEIGAQPADGKLGRKYLTLLPRITG